MDTPETQSSLRKRLEELEGFASKFVARLEVVERSLDDISRGTARLAGAMDKPHGPYAAEAASSIPPPSPELQELLRSCNVSDEMYASVQLCLQRGEIGRAIVMLMLFLPMGSTVERSASSIATRNAQRDNAKDAVAWYRRTAECLVAKHLPYEAAKAYEQALGVDGILLEDRIACLAELGALYERLDFPEDALVIYRQALALDPRPRTDAMRTIEQRVQALEAQGVTVPTASPRQLDDCAAPASILAKSASAAALEALASIGIAADNADGGAEDALLLRLWQRFAALVGPQFNGPRDAVLGFAECSEVLGNIGPAIEAYEAVLGNVRDDDKPPSWVMETRAKLKELKRRPLQNS